MNMDATASGEVPVFHRVILCLSVITASLVLAACPSTPPESAAAIRTETIQATALFIAGPGLSRSHELFYHNSDVSKAFALYVGTSYRIDSTSMDSLRRADFRMISTRQTDQRPWNGASLDTWQGQLERTVWTNGTSRSFSCPVPSLPADAPRPVHDLGQLALQAALRSLGAGSGEVRLDQLSIDGSTLRIRYTTRP